MRTWNSTAASGWTIYAARPELDAWRATQLALLADDPSNPRMPAEPGSEWDAHREGCRVMRAIVAAQRAKLDARTDRQLAKRTDALGALYARAPKRAARKAAA